MYCTWQQHEYKHAAVKAMQQFISWLELKVAKAGHTVRPRHAYHDAGCVANSSYNGYTKSKLKIYLIYTKFFCNKTLKI